MVSTQLQRNDARAIVEWVLGVTARSAPGPDGHHFDLWEKGERVGALLVVCGSAGPPSAVVDSENDGVDLEVPELAWRRRRPRAAGGWHGRSAALSPMSCVGRTGSAAAVNEVVEGEAWRKENLLRLGGSGDGERHLFVWLGEEHGEAFGSMGDDMPPESPLPPLEITTVWVARRPAARAGWLADRVWQTDATGEREALEAVPRSCDHAATRLAPLALPRR